MKKRDIVILHGWNLSGARFSGLADALKKYGYRILAPDFPGFGNAKPPEKPWHVSDYAVFLREYLSKNNTTRPILIGHSFGGRVALKFSEIYPDELDAIILTGTPGFSPVPEGKMHFFLILAKIGGLIFALPVISKFADAARKVLYRLAGAREFYRAEGSMRQTFKHVVRDNLTTSMQSVNVPCLLIWGELDETVPLAVGRKMEEMIPNAVMKVISEADHGVPFKKPALFASYVKSFLG